MNGKAAFTLRGRNPDVLTCIANLSNDEVFTPPEFANRMLDTLADAWAADNDGANLWADSSAKFLDPFTKSGVFLREITSRLVAGLETEIPDLQERIDHILTRQVYGIAITQITSLLARRSVYCSRFANGEHSIVKAFTTEQGNIWFKRTEHTWKGGKCDFCGASQETMDRGEGLESHAYAFIHTDNIKARIIEMFGDNMKFDVVVGNPPYQLNDGGGMGSSAIPIYQKFIEQAKQLDPTFLTMVVPARWMVGGRGLDTFRKEMLSDHRIAVLHDYPAASQVFAGVEIKGGVCYFLWNENHIGDCQVYTHYGEREVVAKRPLLEDGMETFLRHSDQVSLLKKVQEKTKSEGGHFFGDILSANDTFGFDVREADSYRRVKANFKTTPFKESVEFYYNGWRNDGIGYVRRDQIRRGQDLIDVPKLLIPKAWGVGNPTIDRLSAFVVGPNSCSTETYIVGSGFKSMTEAENALTYTQTKFFHFLVSFMKPTQNASKRVYRFVPLVDFKKPWTDVDLHKLYDLSDEEINFVDSLIWSGDPADE